MPCRAMLPHERSLVTYYKKEPFVLLGVNTDTSREALAKAQEKLQVPCRSWWDRGLRICRDWDAESLPTLYLLDHRGVIRYYGTGAPPPDELDRKIEDLLREAHAAS
jgi:hypothetical protein